MISDNYGLPIPAAISAHG